MPRSADPIARSSLEQARTLLVETEEGLPNPLGALGAAALAATAALLMAGVMILGPGFAMEDRPAQTPVSATF